MSFISPSPGSPQLPCHRRVIPDAGMSWTLCPTRQHGHRGENLPCHRSCLPVFTTCGLSFGTPCLYLMIVASLLSRQGRSQAQPIIQFQLGYQVRDGLVDKSWASKVLGGRLWLWLLSYQHSNRYVHAIPCGLGAPLPDVRLEPYPQPHRPVTEGYLYSGKGRFFEKF